MRAGAKVVEELDEEADGVLVEVGLQHAVAQYRDDGRFARNVRLEALLAAHGAGAPEGVDGAGDGGSEQRRRVHLADQRLQHRHAGVRQHGARPARDGYGWWPQIWRGSVC